MQPTNLPARLRAQADRRDAMLAAATPASWRMVRWNIHGQQGLLGLVATGRPESAGDATLIVALRNSAEQETATWRAMADALEYGHRACCPHGQRFEGSMSQMREWASRPCACDYEGLRKAALALVERLEAQA